MGPVKAFLGVLIFLFNPRDGWLVAKLALAIFRVVGTGAKLVAGLRLAMPVLAVWWRSGFHIPGRWRAALRGYSGH